jgi:Tfp pilus assembly protein FimT
MSSVKTSSAFTLTELLVVIMLIVLILFLAVPAFNLISGSGSIDQAQNQISAMFSQAQATAIDRQNYVGVLFYKDTASDRTTLVLVEKVKPRPWTAMKPDGTGMNYRKGEVVSRVTTITAAPAGMEGEPLGTMVRYYVANQDHVASTGNGPVADGGANTQWTLIKPHIVDLVRDEGDSPGAPPRFREAQRLPKNVQVQFPFEPLRWALGTKYYRGQRVLDGNAVFSCRAEHVAAHFFDPVSFAKSGSNQPPNGTYWVRDPSIERYMGIGVVMFDPSGRPAFDTRAGYSVESLTELGAMLNVQTTQPFPFFYGRTDFVMFDQEAFRGAGWNDADPMIDGQANAAETQEEDWLDENATLLIVHKYRGTLGRAE